MVNRSNLLFGMPILLLLLTNCGFYHMYQTTSKPFTVHGWDIEPEIKEVYYELKYEYRCDAIIGSRRDLSFSDSQTIRYMARIDSFTIVIDTTILTERSQDTTFVKDNKMRSLEMTKNTKKTWGFEHYLHIPPKIKLIKCLISCSFRNESTGEIKSETLEFSMRRHLGCYLTLGE